MTECLTFKVKKPLNISKPEGNDIKMTKKLPRSSCLCRDGARGRCCLLEGVSPVPVPSGKASDLTKSDTSSPHSLTAALPCLTFSQQILALAATTKACKREMFYFHRSLSSQARIRVTANYKGIIYLHSVRCKIMRSFISKVVRGI